MEEFCKEHQFVAWYETSAKENINIDEAANCLVTKVCNKLLFVYIIQIRATGPRGVLPYWRNLLPSRKINFFF